MRMRKLTAPRIFFATLLASTACSAAAATFSVSPIRVELDAHHRTSILTFSNSGSEKLRMQVRAMRWTMAPDGEWELTPSDDLIATPELLEIAPGEAVQLRVGSMADTGPSEASYRLLIDELPNLAEQDGPHSPEVRVLTQVSLPVYSEPEHAIRVPVLRSAALDHGSLSIGIGDDGTQRLDAQGVKLVVADSAGRTILQRDQTANYVLAGGTAFLRVKLPDSVCARAQALTLAWPNMAGLARTHSITKGAEACSGAGAR